MVPSRRNTTCSPCRYQRRLMPGTILSLRSTWREEKDDRMLKQEENELITRVGPGTPMGNLMREYWVPAMLSSELPAPDSRPVRVLLLGEQLIAFPRHQRQGRPAGEQLPASRRVAVLRPQRRSRPALRLPRLEVRRRRQLHRHAQRARRERLPHQGQGRRLPDARSAAGWSGPIWARAQTPPPLPDLEGNMLPDARELRPRDAAREQLAADPRRRHRHQPRRLPALRRTEGRGPDPGQLLGVSAAREDRPLRGHRHRGRRGLRRPQIGRPGPGLLAHRPVVLPVLHLHAAGRAGHQEGRQRARADGRQPHHDLTAWSAAATGRGHCNIVRAPMQPNIDGLVRPLPARTGPRQRLPHRPRGAAPEHGRGGLHRHHRHRHAGRGHDRQHGPDLRPHRASTWARPTRWSSASAAG